MNCPICLYGLDRENDQIYTLYDDRYGYPGYYNLFKCKKCLHHFITVKFNTESLIRLYTDYYPRSSFSIDEHVPYQEINGLYNKVKAWFVGEKKSAFRWVPKNVKILDIGCGFGETLGYHKSRGCDVYGVEADDNIRRVAETYNYNVEVGVFDPGLYQKDFFDFVTMDQVVEHLLDPLISLKGIYSILKPGGMLIVTTPNVNGINKKIFRSKWIHWHVPYHVNFFSKKSMKILSHDAGFRVAKVKSITAPEWLYYQWRHLLEYPIERNKSSFWTQQSSNGSKRVNIVNAMNKYHLFHFITKTLDILRIGDNLIYFLEKK